MTKLFCIREEGGKPTAARLVARALAIQAARWAGSLLAVNPRYVLEPAALVAYVRGPNWNDPDIGYAHYEANVRFYGDELRTEFASYRGVSVDEAERRFRLLMAEIGIYKEETR